MALYTYPVQLSNTVDGVLFTAVVPSFVFASIHNEIGSKAYVFVVPKTGQAPSASFLFIGGTVFPASSRALGQDDLVAVVMQPGDVLHGIVEKGLALGIITALIVP